MRGRAAVTAVVALLVMGGSGADAATSRRPDPLRAHQWGLARVHAPEAWRISRGRGIVVAIVDTGIDLGHPDLRGKLVRGVNFVDEGRPPQDDVGHGTHVAGIVAASTDNGVGIAGVAPDARLMPVKALGPEGGNTADIAAGIVWAADHGAKVINLSITQDGVLGRVATVLGQNDVLHEAVAHAWGKGAVLIVAAGNMSYPICSELADDEHVVCVGALGPDSAAGPWYSQRDATMTASFVCAPGGDKGMGIRVEGAIEDNDMTKILSTVGRGTGMDTRRTGYVSLSGTSMAAPHVAGIAALLAARGYRNAEIVRRLTQTAVDLGTPGRDPVYGYGLVDAVRALA